MGNIRQRWSERLISTGRVAAAATKLAAKQIAGVGDADGAVGARIAEELDQMKGVAMKVGQILSYFDGALPDETHKALRTLQTGSQALDYEAIARVVEGALGAAPEAIFERFDRTPIAAASIGQVHRARFRGEEVAVKVQYPGVRETMVADVARLRGLSRLASAATAVDGPALVDELAERFHLECDYELEGRNQEAFRAAFAAEAKVKVPRLIPEVTRTTVLTTEWCEGRSFYAFEESASREDKDAAALMMVHFAMRSIFGAGVINADPHPGNYLFAPGGTVVFLDFGCVRRFEPGFIEAERRVTRAVLAGDRAAFREATLATGIVGKEKGFDWDLQWAMLSHQYAPFAVPEFHFTTEHVRRGMDFSRPSNPNLRRLAIPPQWIWLQRLLWGLYAVLARLDARGPFGAELRAALDGAFAIPPPAGASPAPRVPDGHGDDLGPGQRREDRGRAGAGRS